MLVGGQSGERGATGDNGNSTLDFLQLFATNLEE